MPRDRHAELKTASKVDPSRLQNHRWPLSLPSLLANVTCLVVPQLGIDPKTGRGVETRVMPESCTATKLSTRRHRPITPSPSCSTPGQLFFQHGSYHGMPRQPPAADRDRKRGGGRNEGHGGKVKAPCKASPLRTFPPFHRRNSTWCGGLQHGLGKRPRPRP